MSMPHARKSKASVQSKRVLGVDPGLNVTGYAVVERANGRVRVVEAGVVRTKSSERDLGERLASIHEGIVELLDQYEPCAMALEQVYSKTQHPRTAILMAHARGVIVLASALKGIPVFGYAASRIKKTLTGSGRAPKEQMQHAVKIELGLDSIPEPHDVADACAVALCHCQISINLEFVNESLRG